MMGPPVFDTVKDIAGVRAVLKTGSGPVRVYGFGLAPPNVLKPYAVFQQVYGEPENNLSQRPTDDYYTTQIDVYDEPSPVGAERILQVAQALRDAIEPVAYITAWRGMDRDPETANYRFSFEVDWIIHR